MSSSPSPSLSFRLVQAAAVGVLLGRAWQHLYWDAPYRALLWDQSWMEGPVGWLFGMSWRDYVTHPGTDAFIQNWIVATGVFYVLCALAAVFVQQLGRAGRILLWASSLSLLFLAGLYCKEQFFFLGQFLEYALQVSAPGLLAYLALRPEAPLSAPMVRFFKIAIALTFTCHGLYALGYYPLPGQFVFMTMSIMGVGDAAAADWLKVMGLLDLLLSVLIFLPGRVARYALAYAVFWGLATALARPLAYAQVASWDTVLLQWLHEAVMRFPHFLIPLALLANTALAGKKAPLRLRLSS